MHIALRHPIDLRVCLVGAILFLCLGGRPLWAQAVVQITSPADGAVVNPGKALTVTVTTPPGTVFTEVNVSGSNPIGWGLPAYLGPPYQISLPIPSLILPGRRYQLVAIALPSQGDDVLSAPIWIDVERPDSPASLEPDLPYLILPVGDSERLIRIVGVFSDGTKLDLATSTLTKYASSAPGIVVVDTEGKITAVSPGTASINVTNGTAQTVIQVTVPPAISVMPAAKRLYASQTQQFTSWANYGDLASVTWSINPPGVGTVSPTGLYTAPASIASRQAITITATSTLDNTRSATASVTLYPAISVSVSPPTASLGPLQTQAFTATVANSVYPSVTWSITPNGTGTIDPVSGLYTSPGSFGAGQNVTVVATSVADPTKAGSALVSGIATPLAAPPTFSPPGGNYSTAQVVSLSTTTPGAAIRYTTDGSQPTESVGTLYSGPIAIPSASTITAIAYESGFRDSTISSATYTIARPAGVAFTPVAADTYISSLNPSTSYGSVGMLSVGNGGSVLIRFDLSKLPAGVLPANVQHATLSVFVNRVNTVGAMDVSTVASSWSEATTFATAPAVGALSRTVAVSQTNSWITLDVTGLVQGWLATPSSNFGVYISPAASSPSTWVYLDSKENTTTSHPARLDIGLTGWTPELLVPVGDASIDSTRPTVNLGSQTILNVSGSQSSLVQFDLSALPPGTLPTNVVQATLFLWCETVPAFGPLDVAQVTGQWNESSVTFGTAPTAGAVVGAITSPVAFQWVTIDLTALVQTWVANPTTNYGIRISPSAGSPASVVFDSKEYRNPARLQVFLNGSQ